jgi:hypothetical protein
MKRRTILMGLTLALPLAGCQPQAAVLVEGDPEQPIFRFLKGGPRGGPLDVLLALTVHRIESNQRVLVWAVDSDLAGVPKVPSLRYGETKAGLTRRQPPLPLMRNAIHLVQISGGNGYSGGSYFAAPNGRLLMTSGTGDLPLQRLRKRSGVEGREPTPRQ